MDRRARRSGSRTAAAHAERAGRLCKADLATDMVRELTELQGTMGGIYAREEGQPEAVWKAIYYHYLPVGVEADAPPTRQQLGAAAVTWAAVSLADKLDSVVGHVRGRRAADRLARSARPAASGAGRGEDSRRPAGADRARRRGSTLGTLLDAGGGAVGRRPASRSRRCRAFMRDRVAYLFEQRGFDVRSVRAVMHARRRAASSPLEARRKLEALAQMSGSEALLGVATLLKRVKNITKGVRGAAGDADGSTASLDGAGGAGAGRRSSRRARPAFARAAARGDYREAFAGIAALQPAVAKFFDDVLVMAEDERAASRAAGAGGARCAI